MRMEFFLDHPFICFEFLPNVTLLKSELLPSQTVCRNPQTRVSSTAEKFMSTSAPFLA